MAFLFEILQCLRSHPFQNGLLIPHLLLDDLIDALFGLWTDYTTAQRLEEGSTANWFDLGAVCKQLLVRLRLFKESEQLIGSLGLIPHSSLMLFLFRRFDFITAAIHFDYRFFFHLNALSKAIKPREVIIVTEFVPHKLLPKWQHIIALGLATRGAEHFA